MAHTIRCRDCKGDRQARNRNTKYCHHCRLLRNVEYFMNPHSFRKCASCKETYAPIDRADVYCGKCTLGLSTVRGECRRCGDENAYLARPGVNVCKVCARDPAQRRGLIIGLQKGQATRVTENARRIQEQEARDKAHDERLAI